MHVEQYLGLFGSLVQCPMSKHHVYDYHFTTGISCWNCLFTPSKNLDTGVVIPRIQNSLRYIEVMNIKMPWGEGVLFFFSKMRHDNNVY
jgi:hypothetical protein